MKKTVLVLARLAALALMISAPVALQAGSCSTNKCGEKKVCSTKKRCGVKKQCKKVCKTKKHCPKKRCKTKNYCAPKKCEEPCAPKCEVPAPEIRGVLCEPYYTDEVTYCPKPDCEREYYVPCEPTIKEVCEEQPPIIVKKYIPRTETRTLEYEVTVVDECTEEVPQPAVKRYVIERQPDKCCSITVPCAPEKKVTKCLRYRPVGVCNGDGSSDENKMMDEVK